MILYLNVTKGKRLWLRGTQVEAIRLALELSSRLPNLVSLLQGQDAYAGGSEGNGTCASLRRGYAVALRQSLFGAGCVDNLDAPVPASRE